MTTNTGADAEPDPGSSTAVVVTPLASTGDGPDLVWFGPVLKHLDQAGQLPDLRDHVELWVVDDYGLTDRFSPYVLFCDAEIGDADEPATCDAPAVALTAGTYEVFCADHLDTEAPDLDRIRWRTVTWTDNAADHINAFATAALSAHAYCDRNGGNVPDLLAAGLQQAATELGSELDLIRHRPGSWEASHVAALAYVLDLPGR